MIEQKVLPVAQHSVAELLCWGRSQGEGSGHEGEGSEDEGEGSGHGGRGQTMLVPTICHLRRKRGQLGGRALSSPPDTPTATHVTALVARWGGAPDITGLPQLDWQPRGNISHCHNPMAISIKELERGRGFTFHSCQEFLLLTSNMPRRESSVVNGRDILTTPYR